MYTPDTGDTIGQGRDPGRGRPGWLRVLLGIAGAFILLGAGAAIGAAGKSTASPQPTVTVTAGNPVPTETVTAGDPVLQCQAQGGTWDGSTCSGNLAAPSPSDTGSLTGPPGTAFTITTQDQSGNDVSYDVTAVRVADPATGSDQFNTPSSGNRFVGVEFRIAGGSGYSTDDANSDATLIGDNGQTYTADFNSLSEGTNFNSGQFGVRGGQVQTGWVAFQVPKGVKVSSVQWQPGISSGQPAEWDLR